MTPFRDEYPELFASLVVDRNMSWMPRLEGMVESDDIELVLVGALHLVGEKGILSQLSKRGCSVEHFVGTPLISNEVTVVDGEGVDQVEVPAAQLD